MGWRATQREARRIRGAAFRRMTAVVLILAGVAVAEDMAETRPPIRVAVLADRGRERCIQQWTPLVDYLQQQIPEHSWSLLPYTHEDFLRPGIGARVDIAIISPVLYVVLETRADARHSLSLISDRTGSGQATRLYSAVVCRADDNRIQTLVDLRGKRVAGVSPTGLGGWLAGVRALKRAGVDIARHGFESVFLGGHDAVLNAVMKGEVDAGVCRADIIPNLVRDGKLAPGSLRVLPPPAPLAEAPAYPATDGPYPDWAVAYVPHISVALRTRLATVLMALPVEHPVLVAANVRVFVPPDSYTEIHTLLRELQQPPYEDYGKLTMEQAVRRYGIAAAGVVLLILLYIATLRALVSRRTRELRENQEQLSATLRCIGDGVIACDAAGRVTNLNLTAEKLTGWSAAEATNRPLTDVFRIVNAETRTAVENPAVRSLREGVIVGLANHTLLVARDGSEYQIADSCAPVRDLRGRVIGVVLVFRDVTESYAQQEAIRMSEQEKALILEGTRGLVALHNVDRRLRWANHAYLEGIARVTGKSVRMEDVRGRCCSEVWGFVKKCETCPVTLTLQTGRTHEAEMTPEKLEDWPETRGLWWVQAVPVRDAQGKVTGVIEMRTDITAHKRAEEAQRRLCTLESLGTTAGGIAHDFNNLLMGIFGNIEMARTALPADHPAFDSLQAAHRALESARRLTKQLLTFATGGSPVIGVLDLHQTLREVVRFILAGSNVAARFDIAADLWPVLADKGLLDEVVWNLAINARDAMPRGGTLQVKAQNVADFQDAAVPELHGRHVRVAFRDDGTGISPHVIGRIFDPYFTTKQGGSGLGLAIVYSIVTRHRGHIAVESEPGRGTTFTLFLPAAEPTAPPSAAKPAPSAPPQAAAPPCTGRVLLMDDDEILRDVTRRMLVRLGHEVTISGEGRDAITRYKAARESGKPFDVVIMDLTIPGGMGGKEAIGELLALDAAARVIVASGYSSDPILADFAAYGFRGALAKPFVLKDLATVMARVMNDG